MARRPKLTLAWSGDGARKTALLTKPLTDDWTAHVTFVEQDGQPVVHALQVFPSGPTPAGGLPTTLLRKVLLGELLTEARRALGSTIPEARAQAAFLEKRPRTGRPRVLTDEYLARVAVLYEQFCLQHPGAVRERMAKRLRVPPARVRDLVHETRRRGLLTDGVRGKAGGRATKTAKALLAKSERKNAPATRKRPGARQQEDKS